MPKKGPIATVRPPRIPAKPGVVEGGLRRLHPPQPGFVRFRAPKHPKIGLVAELNGPIVPVDGFGNESIVDRPGRVGITVDTGRNPYAQRIPILLDRWQQHRSVEPEIRMLERMLGLDRDLPRRPLLVIEGQGIPHSYERAAHLRWKLTDPDWDDSDIRYVNNRDRAFVAVSVLARVHTVPESLAEPEDGVNVGKRGRAFFRSTSRLNTLREISRHVRVPVKDLKKLNEKLPKDPDKALRAGTRVRVD